MRAVLPGSERREKVSVGSTGYYGISSGWALLEVRLSLRRGIFTSGRGDVVRRIISSLWSDTYAKRIHEFIPQTP